MSAINSSHTQPPPIRHNEDNSQPHLHSAVGTERTLQESGGGANATCLGCGRITHSDETGRSLGQCLGAQLALLEEKQSQLQRTLTDIEKSRDQSFEEIEARLLGIEAQLREKSRTVDQLESRQGSVEEILGKVIEDGGRSLEALGDEVVKLFVIVNRSLSERGRY
ncbi:hypothetical protein HIM_09202 [Hirsutella minnesotensis 3608]|uniref:Uncharacterized protein n=1 Tax=Hirsutella minnesotensis 3608 TaxID=1043627 RepID=A0A0F8A390_9HYPO|nr:hypothetical protein HIM_09202 [Hirsutella minnesotensis 3608]